MGKYNYTNLAETYFNNKTTNRINFYAHYKNDENSIDDPIFTGFTFDIDTLHSPLFFTDPSYENAANDTLRKTSGSDTSLADIIEKRLSNVNITSIVGAPDSYELNTISSKDIISKNGNEHQIGYGLQDKFYIDNVLYGATDYIYMVDKVTKGAYSDEIGNTNIGNGTPTSSIYDTYSKVIKDSEEQLLKDILNEEEVIVNQDYDINGVSIIDDLDVTPEKIIDSNINTFPISKEIEKTEEKLDIAKNSDTHKSNIKAKETAEAEYNNVYNDYKTEKTELDKLNSEVDTQREKVKSELSDLQSKVVTELNRLMVNPSMGNSSVKEIETIYENYIEFCNGIKNKTSYNKIDIKLTEDSKNKDFSSRIDKLNETVKEEYNKDINLANIFKYAWKIENTQIISTTPTSETTKDINTKKQNIQDKENQLYGYGKSASNADEESLYYKLQKAKDTLNNDEYSQLEQKKSLLEDAKKHYDDTRLYEEYNNTKTITTYNLTQLPTMDPKGENETDEDYNKRLDAYTQEVENIKSTYTRQKYEVPQTVYDMMGFITGMKKLAYEYPYVMQSVTGLEEAYKKYFNMKEPYQGSGDDKITITCYESLDLRVSSMFNKYFNAVYDHQYKRERVPINLRRFCCSVFVHDIRNFRHALSVLNINDKTFNEMIDGDSVTSKIIELALNYMSVIEFKFYDCEIVPEETGSLFDSVSNETGGDMKKTNFTFTYGNCVINFLPFKDLKTYYQPQITDDAKPSEKYTSDNLYEEDSLISGIDDKNFRRWFDKSSLGNINNNDYRDYIRHDSSVEVDDLYKTSIVNNFALNSVVDKNQELTQMDDALRKIVVGISASTGIPVKGVVDSLNIGNIYAYINKGDGSDMPIVKDLGNVTNSKVVDEKTMEYKGEVIEDYKTKELDIVKDLGKI